MKKSSKSVPSKPQSAGARRLNARFDLIYRTGRAKSDALLAGWQLATSQQLRDSDRLYWLIFIHGHDAINARPDHTASILKSWQVDSKIARSKAAGEWPPEPRRNHQVLPWFLAVYPDYAKAAILAKWRPPTYLRKP
ncbi:hypothetical protein [Chitinilyticum aquatile]|uniref:hypothetical protein n=1 Tax=Chitinilyticum aquatile TaxID=362520 RepID=UPI0012DBFCFB|nr:hypothetical protein [Chitinilyticum aquatile]